MGPMPSTLQSISWSAPGLMRIFFTLVPIFKVVRNRGRRKVVRFRRCIRTGTRDNLESGSQGVVFFLRGERERSLLEAFQLTS